MKREMKRVLNPTIWRTCRALAGATRLSLLRRLILAPGQTVTQLAEAEGLSVPRASQELRRLQSRGLLRAERLGAFVRYYPDPDPQVATAKPILKAVVGDRDWISFGMGDGIRLVGEGMSYERRLDILRELKRGAREEIALRESVGQPWVSFRRHLRVLRRCGWVERDGGAWRLAANGHPLAKCLRGFLDSEA